MRCGSQVGPSACAAARELLPKSCSPLTLPYFCAPALRCQGNHATCKQSRIVRRSRWRRGECSLKAAKRTRGEGKAHRSRGGEEAGGGVHAAARPIAEPQASGAPRDRIRARRRRWAARGRGAGQGRQREVPGVTDNGNYKCRDYAMNKNPIYTVMYNVGLGISYFVFHDLFYVDLYVTCNLDQYVSRCGLQVRYSRRS